MKTFRWYFKYVCTINKTSLHAHQSRKNGGFMQEIILIKDEIPWDKEELWKIIH